MYNMLLPFLVHVLQVSLLCVVRCRTVDGSTLLLIDSGGQYDCGTTDITRTVHFGNPSAHQKRCYTRVLQGHIALSQVGPAV